MRSSTDRDAAMASVSSELAALGPYFAVEFHDAQAGSPWRSMSELVDVADVADPAEPADAAGVADVMTARVAGVRDYLATGTGQEAAAVELRVAASVVHLGMVARVVSPLLALAVLYQRVGQVRAADLYWQPTLGSMFPLSVRAQALDAEGEFTLGGVISEFGAAIARFGVNEHIVRGNVASALAGAGKTLALARPELRGDIRTLIDRLMAGPDLAGTGAFAPNGAFRRRSCCLIYRAAPDHKGGLCGDCVLVPARGPMDR